LRTRIGVWMLTISVGTLHYQQIAVFALSRARMHNFPGSDLAVADSADVAGEEKLRSSAVGGQGDLSHRRAEYVRGANKAERQLVAELLQLAEVDWPEKRQALLRLFHGVERQRRLVLGGFRLVVERCIFFLEVSGIGEQNAAQINGCRRRVDRAVKALLHQPRDPATVIDVRMGQDDGVDRGRWHRKVLPIALAPFLLALEQPTIHQDLETSRAVVVHVDQVLRAGNNSGRAKKLNIAQSVLASRLTFLSGTLPLLIFIFNNLRCVSL